MPWTVDDPPDVAKNWTEEEKRRCVAAANAVLERGGSDEEAIFACIHAAGRGEEMETKAVTKTEDGQQFTADAYLYVPDPEKPSTWKLRVEETPGKVTVDQLGRAAAALGPGFMGRRVQLPEEDRRKCARKLIALYRKMDVADEDIPAYLWGIAGMAAPTKALAVKFVDEDDAIIEGLAIPFGGPMDGKDLVGEYFSPETDLCLKWYEERPLLYHHGLDDTVETVPVGRQIKAHVTDVGVWAQAQLDKSNRYFQKIKELIEQGRLFFSSGALAHLVKKRPDGAIIRWPWVELSLTPTPCNPYAIVAPQAKANFEACGLKFVDLAALEEPRQSDAEGAASGVGEDNAGETTGIKTKTQAQEEIEMDEKTLNEMIAKRVEEALAAKAKAEEEARKAREEEEKRIEERARELAAKMVAERKIVFPTGKSQIQVVTPYDELSVEDLAFLGVLLKAAGQKPSEMCLKAMAMKGYKAVEQGDLPVKALSDLAIKADEVMHSDLSNYGDEWVPTLWETTLWKKVRLEARVASLFRTFEMPSNPYEYPIESTDPTIYKVAETADESSLPPGSQPTPDSKVGTGKVTFTAGKIGALSYFSEELVEDAIIPIVPQLRAQFGEAMVHGIDEVLISGDETTGTSNISYYGSTISSSSRFLAIDGLRHLPLVTTTANARDAGTLTAEDVNATRKLMGTAGKYGVNPGDLVIICDPATYYKFLELDEVITVDKMGSGATILNGQLASIWGIPIVVSEDYSLTDSSGYINATASNNTQGSFLIVHKGMWMLGYRRRVKITVGDWPWSDAHYILGTVRFDLQYFDAEAAALSYNISV